MTTAPLFRARRRVLVCLGAVLGFAVGFAQTGRPAFEVAAVKPNHSGRTGTDDDWDHGRVTVVNMTLKRCIAQAYEMREDQISGPDWLSTERYDIVAKAESKADGATMRKMFQSLIEDRFKLATHRASKEERVYALVPAKGGVKIKPLPATGDSTTNGSRGALTATTISMQRFADRLSRMVDMPVVDQTGLAGAFSFKLTWDPAANKLSPDAPSDSQGLSIFEAMQQQLGLELKPRRAQVEILVVDHAERIPVEN